MYQRSFDDVARKFSPTQEANVDSFGCCNISHVYFHTIHNFRKYLFLRMELKYEKLFKVMRRSPCEWNMIVLNYCKLWQYLKRNTPKMKKMIQMQYISSTALIVLKTVDNDRPSLRKSEIKLYFDVTRSIQLRCVPFY